MALQELTVNDISSHLRMDGCSWYMQTNSAGHGVLIRIAWPFDFPGQPKYCRITVLSDDYKNPVLSDDFYIAILQEFVDFVNSNIETLDSR